MGRQVPFTKVPMAALASVLPPQTHALLPALDQMQDRLNEALRPLRQSPQQLMTAKGSLIAASGPGSPAELKAGTSGAFLRVDTTASAGVSWSPVTIGVGTGTPLGVVSAVVGSLFLRTDGGAGTTLYVKESGTGTAGWVAK